MISGLLFWKPWCSGACLCLTIIFFRCMSENGDIAFVKHTTAFLNTDGNNPADWAKDLSSNVSLKTLIKKVMATQPDPVF